MYLLRKKRRPLSPLVKLPRGKQRIEVSSRYKEPPKKHSPDEIPKQNKIVIKRSTIDVKQRNYSQRSGPTQRSSNAQKKSDLYHPSGKVQSDHASKSTSRNKEIDRSNHLLNNSEGQENYEEDFQNEEENYETFRNSTGTKNNLR